MYHSIVSAISVSTFKYFCIQDRNIIRNIMPRAHMINVMFTNVFNGHNPKSNAPQKIQFSQLYLIYHLLPNDSRERGMFQSHSERIYQQPIWKSFIRSKIKVNVKWNNVNYLVQYLHLADKNTHTHSMTLLARLQNLTFKCMIIYWGFCVYWVTVASSNCTATWWKTGQRNACRLGQWPCYIVWV